jgi:hypothetical protein
MYIHLHLTHIVHHIRGVEGESVEVESHSEFSSQSGVESRVGVESIRGRVPVRVESIQGSVPFGVNSHSGFSPIRGWVHSGFSPIRGSVHSGLSPIRGWVHSRSSPFEVQSIRGWVFLGSVFLGSVGESTAPRGEAGRIRSANNKFSRIFVIHCAFPIVIEIAH